MTVALYCNILDFKIYGIVECSFTLRPDAVSCKGNEFEAKFAALQHDLKFNELFLGPCNTILPSSNNGNSYTQTK